MTAPELPDSFYAGIGRLTFASTQLQGVLGLIAHNSQGGPNHNSSWVLASGGAGKVHAALNKLTAARPDNDELLNFWTQAQQALNERNNIVHSLLVRQDPSPINKHTLRWYLVQTKDLHRRDLPTEADILAVVKRMHELSRRAYEIAKQLRAEKKASH